MTDAIEENKEEEKSVRCQRYTNLKYSTRMKHSLMHFGLFKILVMKGQSVTKNTLYMLFSSTQVHVCMMSFIFTIENVGIRTSLVSFR